MNRFILILLAAIPAVGFSQVELDQLTAPTSPASAITGLQPATILAPKSYQALETALYNNFTDDGKAVIPKDFALEFTPYWTKDHGLTLEEYLYPSGIEAFLRNSSFSLASTQSFQLGDSSQTNGLGFGYRTTLFFPFEADKKEVNDYLGKQDVIQAIESGIGAEAAGLVYNGKVTDKASFLSAIKQKTISTIVENGYAKEQSEADELATVILEESFETLPELNPEDADAFLDSFYVLVEKHLKVAAVFTDFKSYLKIRHGVALDLAYANFTNFPTNDFEFSYVPKQSFWVTPNIRWTNGKSALKVLLAYRYEWYNTNYYTGYFPTSDVYRNNHDVGISVAGEFKKWSVQFEFTGRSKSSLTPVALDLQGNPLYKLRRDSDKQYLLTLNYSLTDAATLTYTLGSKFEDVATPQNSLVSVLTLNLGFGSPFRVGKGILR